ncbi:MAG: hypothetical protein MNPFHGCM_00622 [Gemmatimonadaceae bacterium]|nr:hypothetical protein [Gemmatimonadaceae bacterium]
MSRGAWLQVRLPLLVTAFGVTACASDSPTSPRLRDSAPSFGQVQQDMQGLYVIETSGATEPVVAAISQAGGRIRSNVPQIRMISAAGLDAGRAAALAKRSDVVGVYRDVMISTVLPKRYGQPLSAPAGGRAQGPDQSGAYFYPAQWNLPRINANTAWQQTNSGAGRTVWVLDTGYDPYHIDLSGHQPCYSTGITVPRFMSDVYAVDFNFHGSFVSGIIASNGLGMASVAPSARVCTRKVLSEDGKGTFGDLASSLVFVADVGANVVNMSLGAYFDSKTEGGVALLRLMQAAVDFANRKGAVVVASAGNDGVDLDADGPTWISLPAQLDRVISVGATGPDLNFNYDALASYSNFGGQTGVDLVAPGGDLPDANNPFDLILSVCSTVVCGTRNQYVLAGGTSFAAPQVSATAAIIQAVLGAPSPATVEKCLKGPAKRVGSPRIFGYGRLDVLKSSLCTG